MTAKRVEPEKDSVGRQHERPDANAELGWRAGDRDARPDRKPERLPRVDRENDNEAGRDVEEVAVDVLDHEGKRTLAQIRLPGLTDRASRGVGPERLVVRATVVVAGEPESGRSPEHQHRRRVTKE